MSTQAEKEFQKFAAAPLVKACWVDRASWIAGYETALEQQDELLAALTNWVSLHGYKDRQLAESSNILIAKVKGEA